LPTGRKYLYLRQGLETILLSEARAQRGPLIAGCNGNREQQPENFMASIAAGRTEREVNQA